ncbi:hypothetical protein ACFWP2_11240 [Kitasatospora sp. NPDC058444]|uniref:hypothetical protein n=1 Tax=Kitasatospora sp. NPDC058444 TaxID=3346504 RepID=UPI00364979FB
MLVDDSAIDWYDTAQVGLHRLEDMLVWGDTEAADILCWIAADPDPDRWPVALYSRFHAAWLVYSCGMTEFLLRLLRNEFEEWPLSDVGLRTISDPRFLHDRDEETAWEQGINPWE